MWNVMFSENVSIQDLLNYFLKNKAALGSVWSETVSQITIL